MSKKIPFWEKSQAIADRAIAIQKGEDYYPSFDSSLGDISVIKLKYDLATNPVTRSVYRKMYINMLIEKDHSIK